MRFILLYEVKGRKKQCGETVWRNSAEKQCGETVRRNSAEKEGGETVRRNSAEKQAKFVNRQHEYN
jgi:hypothetical protein